MLEKTSNEHSEAVHAYSSWLKSFEDWKVANKDHPDRQAFSEYVLHICVGCTWHTLARAQVKFFKVDFSIDLTV